MSPELLVLLCWLAAANERIGELEAALAASERKANDSLRSALRMAQLKDASEERLTAEVARYRRAIGG